MAERCQAWHRHRSVHPAPVRGASSWAELVPRFTHCATKCSTSEQDCRADGPLRMVAFRECAGDQKRTDADGCGELEIDRDFCRVSNHRISSAWDGPASRTQPRPARELAALAKSAHCVSPNRKGYAWRRIELYQRSARIPLPQGIPLVVAIVALPRLTDVAIGLAHGGSSGVGKSRGGNEGGQGQSS